MWDFQKLNLIFLNKRSSGTKLLIIGTITPFLIFIFILLLNKLINERSFFCQKSYHYTGLNILDGSVYAHHRVLTRLSQPYYPMKDGYLIEMNGLMVPEHFDCDIFNNGSIWGGHPYYVSIAPRWHNCHLHMAMLKSGLIMYQPQLPIIDEEYFEMVAVYDAVYDEKTQLVVAEL